MSSSTPRTGKKPDRATKAKIAEQRAKQRRADRRRRILTVVGSVVGIAAIVGALVAIKVTHNSSGPTSAIAVNPAPASVVKPVTSVPKDVLATVGLGTSKGGPTKISGSPLTAHGKPEILYVGAEYCPFCGGERWALTQALSRFGTFDNLKITKSSANDNPSALNTFSFRDVKYTSDYLTFTPVETQTSDTKAGPPAPLHKLSAAQTKLVTKYNTGGGIPFLDFANKYASSGATFDVSVIQGKTWQQIADSLDQPSSPVAQAIDGSANLLTATLCNVTGDQPANVCGTKTIDAIQKQLAATGKK